MSHSVAQIIFLDWDGTLSVSRFWNQYEVEKPDRSEQIRKILFGASDNKLITSWMRGQLSAEDISIILEHHSSVSRQIWLEDLERSCRNMQLIDPGILRLIDQLRQSGFHIVLATDNMDTFVRWTVPALSLNQHFDAVLSSSELGLLKQDQTAPSVRPFFDTYLKGLPTTDETLLIDDSPEAKKLMGPGFNVKIIERGSHGACHLLSELALSLTVD